MASGSPWAADDAEGADGMTGAVDGPDDVNEVSQGGRGRLRVAFFGTPAFAVPTLEALFGSRHTVVGVVTQPDRPRGRGHRVSDAPVKAVAAAHGLACLQPAQLARAAFEAPFSSLRAELGVVAAYGKILPEWLIQAPRLGMINVHASLLPRYRGAAPVHRAVMAGESTTGVTIMRVVKALDAGPMLARGVHTIGPDDTSVEVEQQLARLGAALLADVVEAMAQGGVAETPQNDADATYAPRLTREDGSIDWSRSAQAVHDQVRGLHPWPHAFTFLGEMRYLLHRTHVTGQRSAVPAGTIVEATTSRWLVTAGDGRLLEIRELQVEGGRVMNATAFLAGHPIAPGSRFR
jgi:methionyl-tRNA formyltransferase